jgi:hypothetical protein
MAKNNVRPFSIIPKPHNPVSVLKDRGQYFRDVTGNAVIVMVQGIPVGTTMSSITYLMLHTLSEEQFEWAYPWRNPAGVGHEFEPNALRVTKGYSSLSGVDQDLKE